MSIEIQVVIRSLQRGGALTGADLNEFSINRQELLDEARRQGIKIISRDYSQGDCCENSANVYYEIE